jgi:hypothetical protein
LLGQSFLHHFTVSGSPESGQVVMSRVGGQEGTPTRVGPTRGAKKARRGAR